MCESRIKCRCLTSFDFFFFNFLTLGQFNARIATYFYQDVQIYLADSGPTGERKISQRFYFACLNCCPTTKGHSKLTCLRKNKNKEELQHSFHTPTRPRGSSTSFLWLFLEASVFFSRPATKDVLCCYWGLCVWLTLELFLESAVAVCID